MNFISMFLNTMHICENLPQALANRVPQIYLDKNLC